jgi:hypothetical protein
VVRDGTRLSAPVLVNDDELMVARDTSRLIAAGR